MLRGNEDGFFRTLGKSFSFFEYDKLSEKNIGTSIRYFLKLMVFATIIMFLLAIPAFVDLSKNVDKVLNNFEDLTISVNATSKGPIILFPGDKYKEVKIDWENNATTIEDGKFLITKESFVKKTFFGSQYTDLKGYSNVLDHKDVYKKSAMILAAFLIPSLVVGAYVFFSIKFFIMILLLALVGFIITRIIRFDIDFKNCMNISIYAWTIGILISMFVFPYNIQIPYFRIEWIGYILTAIYFIVGLKNSGYLEGKKDRKDRKKELERRRKYLTIKD